MADINLSRVAYPRENLSRSIVKPVVRTPILSRVQPVAFESLKTDTPITIGLYDEDGNIEGSKNITMGDLERELNSFTGQEVNRFVSQRISIDPNTLNRLREHGQGDQVVQRVEFDRDLNENIDVVEIPQELEISTNLVIQRARLTDIPARPLTVARPIVARPIRVNPTQPAHDPKPFSKNVSYGNTWGSKSKFAAFLEANAKSFGSREKRLVEGEFNAGGYVFNKNITLVAFNTNVERKNQSNSGHTSLKVLGQTKWEVSGSTASKTLTFTREESKRQRFWVGPIPVSVGGAIGGSVGVSLNLHAPDAKSLAGNFEPFIDSYAEADAAIDVWLARAGIEGDMRIVKNSFPVSTKLIYNPDKQNLVYKLSVNSELAALDGKISVYAKVKKLLGGWRKWSKTILSWSGLEKTWTLIDEDLTVNI